METEKYKKLYLWINIPIILVILVLLVIPLFIIDNTAIIYYLGIVCRVFLGIWCIFNGVWNAKTDYYSILKNNRFQKSRNTPKWAWWLVFIVGVICIITACMGFGFNGVKKPL